ncbi:MULTISPECIES: single-stranded-DNA-specific exonuclease RecJ [Acidobacteriaceae]|uniref:single-stranded-DNA-specific exonuclease RecJ n=1 Tax=Acidobacteriaceae TaxID=204434 RepID=UPI00131D021E|nr:MULTISPECIES: single-stranded-DNA-specific exonuclease RecJ [Acidobacteriaceae]MDW5266468.1 single-stranded-DNA-specific exonuclease RecJ [Edaphobacter sp.]
MISAQNGLRQEWAVASPDADVVGRLARELGCPDAIAALLVSRGIVDVAAAQTFFNPSLDDLIDPMLMLGMREAVARIQQAVRGGEPILIYGDYDVDGTTATVLLKTAIERTATKDCPAVVTYHVPHRLREGYGMQTGVLGAAAASGVRLVISVDTGIRAFAAADEAKALGLDLIVTDHHLPDDAVGVPHAIAVVNPAQEGCGYPFKSLCGAGVAFKLAHAILSAAADTEEGRAKLRNSLVPSFLKLVAIATIADSVPLEGENRVIAALGLRELRNPVQPGLRALMQVAQIPANRPPTATEVGFRLAPRINAAGRMDIASDVVELFLTRDVELASKLAEKLNRLNEDRRATEARALEDIEVQLASLRDGDGTFPSECIVLDDPSWHRGVLGILASRIVDRTGRPALVLTHEDGHAHGSGRSIAGFHLLDALTAIHADGELFTRFGGHTHAVGFSLPSESVATLRTRMRNYSSSILDGPLLAPPLECDVELSLNDLTPEFFDWLTRCGPFGIGNREPVFATRGVTLSADVRLIKEKHVCLQLCQGSNPARFSALGWSRGAVDWPARCAEMELRRGSIVDIAYRLKGAMNPQFPGLELELLDLKLS